MFNYREHFITVTAIFLSLAFGILVGISFGEDYLVSNQREIIELMEQELNRRKQVVLLQEDELQRWEKLKPLIWRAYSGKLSGKSFAILAVLGTEEGQELEKLLEGAGAKTYLVKIPAGVELSIPESLDMTFEELVRLLTGTVYCPEEGGSEEMSIPPAGANCGDCLPDRYLIAVGGNEYPETQLLEKIWISLLRGGAEVVGIFSSWQESRAPSFDSRENPVSLVNNIDTVWGQVALLEMLVQELTGRYGICGAGNLLMPPLERNDRD